MPLLDDLDVPQADDAKPTRRWRCRDAAPARAQPREADVIDHLPP